MLLRNPCKNLKSYDNPFWKNSDDGRKKKKKKKKKEKREKVNDYSGTIVSERRRWRTHTLGPKISFLPLKLLPQYYIPTRSIPGLTFTSSLGIILVYTVISSFGKVSLS